MNVIAAGDYFTRDSDPYCKISFEGKIRRTSIKKGTINPVFNETFVLWQKSVKKRSNLTISVYDQNIIVPNQFLGHVHISGTTADTWYPLRSRFRNKGTLRVAVRRVRVRNAEMLNIVQTIVSQERALNDVDLKLFGALLPEVWEGQAEAEEPAERHRIDGTSIYAQIHLLSRKMMGKQVVVKTVL